jgi:GNAT superfamily N-acetyltransferase
MPGAKSQWSFRAATRSDYDLVYEMRRTAFIDHVLLTYGPWDEAWQRERFDAHFHPEKSSIIVSDGRDVGELVVEWDEDPVFLALLVLLPEARGRGIGTAVIWGVLDRARELGKAVRLQVFVVNPDARRLYERLGFRETGTNETHVQMLWDLA